MYKCAMCKAGFKSLLEFKMHLPIHGGSRYFCGEGNCGRTFSGSKELFRHLREAHKCCDNSDSDLTQPNLSCNVAPTSSPNDEPMVEDFEVPNADVIAPYISALRFKECYAQSVEVLVAKLYKNPSIPRNFVQTLINDIDLFLNGGFLEVLESKVLSALKSYNVEASSVDDISEIFGCLRDPFKGLDTDYRRMEYFKANKFYVPPTSFTISESRPKNFNTAEGVVVKHVKTTGQFVPFRKVLQNLFELPGALSATLNYVDSLKNACPDVISNPIQSDLWKLKVSRYFTNSDIVLPLDFYYDDVEPNNALGPHSEKLGAGYILIPALPPPCQSKLENIFLVLLIDADDRKSCTPGRTSYNDEVFKPVIHEFNVLEKKGILCNTADCGEKRVFFILHKVRGDNLGVHGILGLAESFSANYMCVICKAPQSQTKSMTMEDSSLLRDPINYAEDVALGNVTETGIKENCVFNRVRSFHITENMCVDVMHDSAEGLSHYVLIPLLKHCIRSHYFTLSVLNSRLFFFDYGPADSSNKPVPIAEDFATRSKLKGTAKEIMSLVRLLGVIIGDLVPDADPFWKLYLLHKEIQEILLAKALPLVVADELKLLIHEHHTLYLRLIGDLPPKGHYYVHDPRIIKSSGPVVHQSSMRGEAKHRDITKYARAITSRKNLPLSCATKQQLGLCFRFVSQIPLLPSMTCGPGETMCLPDHIHYEDFKSRLLPSLSLNNVHVQQVTWVEVDSILYKPRMVLIYGVSDDSRLKFGKILDMFLYQDKPYFICQRLTNIGVNDHVGGFEVSFSKYYTCISHEELLDPFPVYDFLMCQGERYVILKHYL